MYHAFNFSDVLASSVKAAWQVEDVLTRGLEAGRIAAAAPAFG